MRRIGRMVRALLAVQTALLAGLLCAETIGLCAVGFSREGAAASLRALLAPALLWGALAVAGWMCPEPLPGYLRGRAAPKRVRRACDLTAALCAILSAGYFFVGGHFASWDLDRETGRMLRWVVPWTAVAMIALAVRGSAPVSQKRAGGRKLPARIAVGLLAAGLLTWGAMNGGARDVWMKAVNICTECIGLG